MLLQVVQPEGPSFQVDGHNVVWQQWHLHVGFNFREGLVLSHIGYGPIPAPFMLSLSSFIRTGAAGLAVGFCSLTS